MIFESLNAHQKTLLIAIECAAVDYGGLVKAQILNSQDIGALKQWALEGHIELKRIKRNADVGFNDVFSHFVELKPSAWVAVALARKERALAKTVIVRQDILEQNEFLEFTPKSEPVVGGVVGSSAGSTFKQHIDGVAHA